MPQQEPESVAPLPSCPFWSDGKHLYDQVIFHGAVAAKRCGCEATILIRPQDEE